MDVKIHQADLDKNWKYHNFSRFDLHHMFATDTPKPNTAWKWEAIHTNRIATWPGYKYHKPRDVKKAPRHPEQLFCHWKMTTNKTSQKMTMAADLENPESNVKAIFLDMPVRRKASNKPSTWLPPGGLLERSHPKYTQKYIKDKMHPTNSRRHEQWMSRQRRTNHENDSVRPHQRQYFMKFSIFEISRLRGRPPCFGNSRSLQIRFPIWRKFIENDSFRLPQREYFMKFSIFEIFRLHGRPPWFANSWSLQIRFAIWRHQSEAKDKYNLRKKYREAKRIHRFKAFSVWTWLSHKIRNFGFHDTTRCSKSQPSFQICFAIWSHGSKRKTENTCRKIRLGQTNSRIQSIFGLNTALTQNPFWPWLWPNGLVPVLLFSWPLYESLLKTNGTHRKQLTNGYENTPGRHHDFEGFRLLRFNQFEPKSPMPRTEKCCLIVKMQSLQLCCRTAWRHPQKQPENSAKKTAVPNRSWPTRIGP